MAICKKNELVVPHFKIQCEKELDYESRLANLRKQLQDQTESTIEARREIGSMRMLLARATFWQRVKWVFLGVVDV